MEIRSSRKFHRLEGGIVLTLPPSVGFPLPSDCTLYMLMAKAQTWEEGYWLMSGGLNRCKWQ